MRTLISAYINLRQMDKTDKFHGSLLHGEPNNQEISQISMDRTQVHLTGGQEVK